jgi:ribosomal protein L33
LAKKKIIKKMQCGAKKGRRYKREKNRRLKREIIRISNVLFG